jgi:transposase
MGKHYSCDLRERIVAYVKMGHSRRAAARHFGVSDSFAVKLMQRVTRHGSLAPGQQGRPRGSRLSSVAAFLIRMVEAKPDITMPELAARLLAECNIKAAPAELSRFLCRSGFTYKKSPDGIGTRSRRSQSRPGHLD